LLLLKYFITVLAWLLGTSLLATCWVELLSLLQLHRRSVEKRQQWCTRSSVVAETPRDASLHWIFR